MKHVGRDLIVIPMNYYEEYKRDPADSMLKYGSQPQRARSPWFTEASTIENALVLPDQVVGPKSERTGGGEFKSLVAARPTHDETALLDGLSPHFFAHDTSFFHCHVDLALNKKRHGDAAGIAMGRITNDWLETGRDGLGNAFERIVRLYDIPLVAQIVAPHGDQIYIGAIVLLILQLKQLRGFNITSFSFDGFQSADATQQLTQAGLVTNGMHVDENTGMISGIPKPFSVDRSDQPYRELLEAINEQRCSLPKYALLRKELRELEVVEPGRAPDHAVGSSKDVADPVAGVVGYLAAFGHAILSDPLAGQVFTRDDYIPEGPPSYDGTTFTVDDDPVWGESAAPLSFGVQ